VIKGATYPRETSWRNVKVGTLTSWRFTDGTGVTSHWLSAGVASGTRPSANLIGAVSRSSAGVVALFTSTLTLNEHASG
jgi:hypothetical protein